MSVIGWLGVALAVAAIWQTVSGVRCLRRRRPGGATVRAGGALACLAPLAVIALVGAHLYTWQRLTAEQTVAELSVERIDHDRYRVALSQPGEPQPRTFDLAGDDWRLDAQVLRWHPMGQLLGLDTRYRLERLAGRYRNAERARREPVSVHDLPAAPVRALDALGAGVLQYLPLADARYGSATYLPLADGARYRVSIARDGLIARPLNATAESAVEQRF